VNSSRESSGSARAPSSNRKAEALAKGQLHQKKKGPFGPLFLEVKLKKEFVQEEGSRSRN